MEVHGETQYNHVLNTVRRHLGEKSGMLIHGEPPYKRPVLTVVGEPLSVNVCWWGGLLDYVRFLIEKHIYYRVILILKKVFYSGK